MDNESGLVLIIKILFTIFKVVFIGGIIGGMIGYISTRKYSKKKR